MFPLIDYTKIAKPKLLFNFNYEYLFLLIILLIFLLNFNFVPTYNLTNSGGGFFYNLSLFLFGNYYLFYFTSFLAFLFIFRIVLYYQQNLVIILCIILSNPQETIWQANRSPTIFFLILLLMSIDFIETKFNSKQLLVIFTFFTSYMIISLIKNIYIYANS